MFKKILWFLYPNHWFLKGKDKEVEKIYFFNDPYTAECLLVPLHFSTEYERETQYNYIEFAFNNIDEYEYQFQKLKIDFKFKKIESDYYESQCLYLKYHYEHITEQEYEIRNIDLMPDTDEKRIAALEYNLKYKKITEKEYQKELSTIKKEPWFDFDVEFNEDDNDIVMTFDYNVYFWKKLKADGHPGNDEHEIIDNFIKDWGRKLATEDYDDGEVKMEPLDTEEKSRTGSSDEIQEYK